MEIKNDRLKSEDKQLDVTIKVTAGSEPVKVYLLDDHSFPQGINLKAGETNTFQGKTPVEPGICRVFFDSGETKANNIKYTITYKVAQ